MGRIDLAIPSPTAIASGLGAHLREFLATFGYNSPLLLAVAIDMHFRIKPTRVIEGARVNKGEIGYNGSLKDDW